MKFLIIGTGGTGGAIGGFLAKDNIDVTFIARGEHLNAIKENGLKIISSLKGEFLINNPKAMTAAEYNDTPDVIFVCVKGYSFNDATELIKRVATQDTLIIPVLNVVNTGNELRTLMPHLQITDGCIYIVAQISSPGVITQKGEAVKIIYGNPDASTPEKFYDVAKILENSGITPIVSENIKRDCFRKFILVSPLGAVGAYYNANAGMVRDTPHIMKDYLDMTSELIALAKAMGLEPNADMIKVNTKSVNNYSHDGTASMHRDVLKGGASEMDGLVFEVIRLADKYSVATPLYLKVAKHFGFTS